MPKILSVRDARKNNALFINSQRTRQVRSRNSSKPITFFIHHSKNVIGSDNV